MLSDAVPWKNIDLERFLPIQVHHVFENKTRESFMREGDPSAWEGKRRNLKNNENPRNLGALERTRDAFELDHWSNTGQTLNLKGLFVSCIVRCLED